MKVWFGIVLCLANFVCGVSAEKIILRNGSVLIGTVVSMDEKQVVVRSEAVDQDQIIPKEAVKEIRATETTVEPLRTDEGFWGVGVCLNAYGGVGLQNAIRIWRCQWNVSYLKYVTYDYDGYFLETQLQYNFVKWAHKRFFGLGSLSKARIFEHEFLNKNLGAGFAWDLSWAELALSAGMGSSDSSMLMNIGLSFTHFF